MQGLAICVQPLVPSLPKESLLIELRPARIRRRSEPLWLWSARLQIFLYACGAGLDAYDTGLNAYGTAPNAYDAELDA